MSKGLEELKHIRECIEQLNINGIPTLFQKECYNTIEKELKEYQEISIKYKLAIEFIDNIADEFGEHDLDELADKIVKVKKALEIIKKNSAGIVWKTECSKEDIDFVKEVML